LLLATVSILAAPLAHAQIGIQALPDQNIPSGKTLVVPIPATDPDGPARSYTVTVGTPYTTSGTTTVTATNAGIVATIRTGDPHFTLGVSYTDASSTAQTGTMEFQLLREFSPIATQTIGGLTQAGFYNPTMVSGSTKYITFHRIAPGFVIQGGDPNGNGSGGPGFTFKSEYSNALVFSATEGQLAMANSNGADPLDNGKSNGSQFFVTLSSDRTDLDYGYTIFGHLLRGYDTLNGIEGTPRVDGTTTSPVNPVDITSATVSTNNTDAVLLLSATGVCNALVTVTAVSGTASTTGSFTAIAVPDTISDPPFLQPPPDTTATNAIVKVPIQATDLQLDLIRYGYQRLAPFQDASVTSGSSNVLTIPLIPKLDNIIGAKVDSWNASPRGYVNFNFNVAVGDKPLAGSLAPIAAGRIGQAADITAVFTADNRKDTAKKFTASINWGDDTLVSLSGTSLKLSRDKAKAYRKENAYELKESHTYESPGEYPVQVKIADKEGAVLTLNGTANVSSSSIAISGTEISNSGGVIQNQVVATFNDLAPVAAAGYAATINWGDGTVTSGTVQGVSGSSSTFEILGSHVYQTPDTFTVSTTVVSSGSASASTWAPVHISGFSVPEFPPFPQAHLVQIWSPVVSDSEVAFSVEGGNPYAGLITGTDGNQYGTAYAGGPANAGTVYQAIISGSTATVNTLYTFTGGTDGGNPFASLVQGIDGNFYGSTVKGGAGYGTLFRIAVSGSSATLDTLYSFTGGTDGRQPYGALVQGTNGAFYGTTYADGANGYGTVFEINAAVSPATLQTLYTFTGGTDGGNPVAGLTLGSDGNFYGATVSGGGSTKRGTVYQLTQSGSLTTLYAFTGGDDGAKPFAALLSGGTDGILYGTTETSGSGGAGTVFQITTSGSLTTLYSFTGGSDGGNPWAGLITGTDGSLYGATTAGGTANAGTLYQVVTTGSVPAFTVLYTFTGGNDGAAPYAAPYQGADGNLYGTTETDGAYGVGTIYQYLTSGSNVNTLHAFLGNNPLTTGTSFQIATSGTVRILNSGNVASQPGSFSVYVDPDSSVVTFNALDGAQTAYTSNGQTAFPIPALAPGASFTFTFGQQGSVDSRLKLPVGVNPGPIPNSGETIGQYIIGVVTYSDPVANFDGSQIVISPGHF